MSNKRKIYEYQSLQKVVTRLRSDFKDLDFVLIYAYNRTGKTRLSMAFKDSAKKKGKSDTLYFNAYTEDLFHWDNDLAGDSERYLKINSESQFFAGFKELALEEKIFDYLKRYADFDFKIDYERWIIRFSRSDAQNIKISRGEENIFIWCIFLALCRLVIDGHETYSWVKNLYIDDPISSLDDNNAIVVATDLVQLLKEGVGKLKSIVSSHHALFFNVIWNEFKSITSKKTYFFHRSAHSSSYTLQTTDDTPFLHHVAMLSELHQDMESGQLYTHHFNILRSILEKTATFFGFKDFSACIHGIEDEILFSRALNLLSHGQHSVYEPKEMVDDNKELFKNILTSFLQQYQFDLPDITHQTTRPRRQP